MKKWYSSILKNLWRLGDRVCVEDAYGLLGDPNLIKEISRKYVIYEYKTDGDFFRFFEINKDKKIVIYSNKPLQKSFIDTNFKKLVIEVSSVFEELDPLIIKNVDVSYYQKIFNYYSELKSQGRMIDNTEDVVLKSIWNIDLGHLYSDTENLKIALAYIVDKKDIPLQIIEKVSRKLAKDIRSMQSNPEAISAWIKELLLTYVAEKKQGLSTKYELTDETIQYYLFKINLTYNVNVSQVARELVLTDPWLLRFDQKPSKEFIIDKINSNIKLLYDLIRDFSSKEFDLNDIDSLTKLSKLFSQIMYETQINDIKPESLFNLDEMYDDFEKLFRKLINEKDNKYESLFYFPHDKKPFTADKVLDHICHNFKSQNVALMVFDGMSFDEWYIFKERIRGFNIEEKEIFAIIPTLTSFSRMSIFSGKTPNLFMGHRPQEKKEFYEALIQKGYDDKDIVYGFLDLKNNTFDTDNKSIEFKFLKGYKFIGIVCNLFDDLCHEQIITRSQKMNLYKKIVNELESSSIFELLSQLKKDGYTVIITSDHGNIFCKGNGITSDRILELDEKRESKRCLIFNRESFAEDITTKYPTSVYRYKYKFVPENYQFIFPKINECFANPKEFVITHGGISPEEVVVPFVVLK
jgi:hypothetical protein